MNVEIYPLEKIVIDGIAVYFGMERSTVDDALGKGQFANDRCYYCENELAISFGKDSKVEFIEFLGGVDGLLKPTIYGVSAFDVDSDELFEILRRCNDGEIIDTERGYSYQFPNISVGIYREALPEEITEMIEEAASYGNPMSDDEIAYEMKRARHWATIGIGVGGYYQR